MYECRIDVFMIGMYKFKSDFFLLIYLVKYSHYCFLNLTFLLSKLKMLYRLKLQN